MDRTRELILQGYRIRLDPSRQVFRLDMPEENRWSRAGLESQPLSPSLAGTDTQFVSAAALMFKAKQFDDGLYAAIELAAQKGHGRFPGKVLLLRELAGRLAASGRKETAAVLAVFYAACELGGVGVPTPPPLLSAVRTRVADFLRDEVLPRPIGFYTWTQELGRIYRQDRMLQTELDHGPGTAAVSDALNADPQLSGTYDAYLALLARLTNPLMRPGLRGPGAAREYAAPGEADTTLSFFPPSRSREVDLLEALYRDRPIPEGFDLFEEMIRRIRAGTLSLTPTERSGWYDYQTWALEPLVIPERMPEAGHLMVGKEYRKHLLDLFKAVWALTRETHVKQAGGGWGGGRGGVRSEPIFIYPELTVEPLPTCYSRRALSYRFARHVLEDCFGPGALGELRRLSPNGPSETSLADELAEMEALFDGAAVTARRELGMSDESTEGQAPGRTPGDAAARFLQWRKGIARDEDLARDGRMMVPVFYDVVRHKWKVWAFLGWRKKEVTISFETPPRVLSCERLNASQEAPQALPQIVFSTISHELPTPVIAEVYVGRVLNRDEFRKHCDRFRSPSAILEHLR